MLFFFDYGAKLQKTIIMHKFQFSQLWVRIDVAVRKCAVCYLRRKLYPIVIASVMLREASNVSALVAGKMLPSP